MFVSCKQTFKDVENFYRVIAGFDMSYVEYKDLCREASKNEGSNCRVIDLS